MVISQNVNFVVGKLSIVPVFMDSAVNHVNNSDIKSKQAITMDNRRIEQIEKEDPSDEH